MSAYNIAVAIKQKYARTIIGLFYCCFAILLVSQVCALFPTAFWLNDLLSEFAWQYLLAFIASICAGLLLRRPIIIMTAALGIAINLWALSPLYLPPANNCPNCMEEHLKIVQFNMFFKNQKAKDFVQWSTENSDIDIVVLSEAETNGAALEGMKRSFPYYVGPQESYPSGLAVFSRLPIKESEWIMSPIKTKNSRNMLRLSLASPHNATPITLYVVHFLYSITPDSRIERNASLKLISERIALEKIPHTILIGDMNMSSWHSLLNTATTVSGMKNAQQGQGYMQTWHPSGWRNVLMGMMIDQELVSQDIRIDKRYTEKDFGSDHLPILTSLWLQTPEHPAQ